MKNEDILKLKNGKALLLKKKIDNFKKRNIKLQDKYDKLFNEMRKVCIHNETRDYQEFYEGDYYNTSKYSFITECVICNKQLKHEIKSTKHYG